MNEQSPVSSEDILGRRLVAVALACHFLLGGVVLLVHYWDPGLVARSAVVALLVDSGAKLFGVIENAFLCKPATPANVALVTVITFTSHLILLARFFRDRKKILSTEGMKNISSVDLGRLILIGAFGVFFYYFTFFGVGDPDLIPGFNVLCLRAEMTWLLWTIQTLISVLLVHLCVGTAFCLFPYVAKRVGLRKLGG